jgi:RNA polymerase primary sigma factor
MRTKINKSVKRNGQGDRMMRLYLREISAIPLLTQPEEQTLSKLAQEGDFAARQKLIESNLRFVIKIAKKYAKRPGQLLELINVGNLGLIEAANRFDPARNVRFTTYAIWWIRQAIFHHLAQLTYAFRVPPKMANVIYQVRKILKESPESPENEVLEKDIGISDKVLKDAMMIMVGSLSLQDPTTEEGDLKQQDRLEQRLLPSPEEFAVAGSLRRDIDRCLQHLPLIEQKVVRWRYGMNDHRPQTLREIGQKLNLSRERVRQIENGAIQKLNQMQGTSGNLVSYLT